MRDDEIIHAVEDEIIAILVNADIPEVASVLSSTNTDDLIMRDSEGQGPTIGVIDTNGSSNGNIGLGQKRKRVTVSYELAIAVVDESETSVTGRRMARTIMGYVNKCLDNYLSSVALGRYQFTDWSWIEHPRPELQLLVVRYKADMILGNE